ncbi:hypothetical protein ACGF5C_23225 [Micromonospora sp. NPDC047620]|uniref:hypothetical protein n=1 Tax=Micromonospora sp. NPDC047620 TaxID=3364251 RepID=UPI003715AEA1
MYDWSYGFDFAANGCGILSTSTDYDPAYRLAEFAAARGIRVQLILLDSIVNDPRLAAGARRVHDNGVEVRTTPTLPVWTFVVDDRYVVMAIARQFSVSARTVRRMIADLADRIGATSRFELGVQAVRLGWLDDTPQPAPSTEPFHA